MKQKEKVSITIIWGSDRKEKKTYTFNNSHEKDIFMKGVDEAEGWLKYEIEGDE